MAIRAHQHCLPHAKRERRHTPGTLLEQTISSIPPGRLSLISYRLQLVLRLLTLDRCAVDSKMRIVGASHTCKPRLRRQLVQFSHQAAAFSTHLRLAHRRNATLKVALGKLSIGPHRFQLALHCAVATEQTSPRHLRCQRNQPHSFPDSR
jgi:hypothetical protein